MTVATQQKLITLEEFMKMPESHDHELINGRLVEQSPMGAESSYIAGLLLADLVLFLRAHPAGWAFGADVVFQCFKGQPIGRKPDVSFVRYGRLEEEKIPLGYVKIPPDLAVEVISPNDLAYDLVLKLDQYQRAKIPLIWVVYPNTRMVHILRRNGMNSIIGGDDDLSGEDVIPGFKVRVSALFPPPENVNKWPVIADD